MDNKSITGNRDMDKLILEKVDIMDVINLIDAGIDSKLIGEVLPNIMIKYNKSSDRYQLEIDQLIYDLVDRIQYNLIKIIFINNMDLIFRIIIEYVDKRNSFLHANELIKLIPDNYDWTSFDLEGAFESDFRGNFEEGDYFELLKDRLFKYLSINSLPLLDIVIKTYDDEMSTKFRSRLDDFAEVKRARLRVDIYRLTKSWNNSRSIYDSNIVDMMDDMVDNISLFNESL